VTAAATAKRGAGGRGRRAGARYPARLIAAAFLTVISVGTLLLLLPVATAEGGRASLLTALFTATSALTVTGLVVENTASYWSGFGEGVILALIQIGGFGIMFLASLVAVAVFHRLGLRRRLLTQAETGAVQLGDIRRILVGVAWFTLVFEGAIAVVLALKLGLGEGEPAFRAAYLGVFHAVSAFNNAGFDLFDDSLVGFAGDFWMLVPILAGFVVGGLGFPVLVDLRRALLHPSRWSLHTKLTLYTTGLLLAAGISAFLWFEWSNPGTLGDMSWPGKLLTGVFQGATPRTAGFTTIDYGSADETTLLTTTMLMFVGGGSASTAGGIRLTTFALLGFMMWSEVRAEPDVQFFRRRVHPAAQRQALTVALVGLTVAVWGTLTIMAVSPASLPESLFEAFSAFGTVGLSTGITAELSAPGQLVLIALMFLGRIGPWTFAAALVLRQRRSQYRYPEERPIIG
jgi:trk system potassium uptake protein TrkH